jgi:hypothetical protein
MVIRILLGLLKGDRERALMEALHPRRGDQFTKRLPEPLLCPNWPKSGRLFGSFAARFSLRSVILRPG